MDPAQVKLYSDKLASLSTPIIAFLNQSPCEPLTQLFDTFEAKTRELVTEQLGQGELLAKFDAWQQNG